VFGWTGGKKLVSESYTDAKVKLAEQKAQHAENKAKKRAERAESGRGPLHRGKDNRAADDTSSTPGGGQRDV
jgi:hypothetical protein